MNYIIVPLQKGGSNWEIQIIQIVIRLIPLRVPRSTMANALHELQPTNMKCWHIGRLYWGQYFIIELMHMCHMDCKCKKQPQYHECCFIFNQTLVF
jgi:hypothetical protein